MFAGPISVPETWTLPELVAAGWRESDLEWERAAESAVEHLAHGDVGGAADQIARSLRIANEDFSRDDPRLGASLANHGAALNATGEAHLSGRTIADALRTWREADSFIAKMTAPRVARSSLFHMRMEQRHRATYEERWRIKWAELAADARAQIGGDGQLTLIGTQEAAERLQRWQRERPAMLNDTRKLMAAVILLACRR
jgi:hypothetical protein